MSDAAVYLFLPEGIADWEPGYVDADDFFGRDVALAARIANGARGGEILVSAIAKALLDPSRAFGFEGPRELELKGFDGAQRAYAVVWDAGGEPTGASPLDRAGGLL